MPGYQSANSGLVTVTHAGAAVAPEDAATYATIASVHGELARAIEPFAERMRELGGYVVADVPVGLAEVNIQVGGVPPDLAQEILSRCYAQLSG